MHGLMRAALALDSIVEAAHSHGLPLSTEATVFMFRPSLKNAEIPKGLAQRVECYAGNCLHIYRGGRAAHELPGLFVR